jgi:hypothetical protein
VPGGMKYANHALENVQGKDEFKVLAQIQQAWLRDLVQDYASQSVHCSEMMSQLAASAMAHAVDAGRAAVEEGQDVLRQGQEVAGENLKTIHQAGTRHQPRRSRSRVCRRRIHGDAQPGMPLRPSPVMPPANGGMIDPGALARGTR